MTHKEILKQYWGYDSFRGIQEEIIDSISSGSDTLGLMPTGGGKSITFQVPALAVPGVCLVITPLISLMNDQVQNLRQRGITAHALHSGLSRQQTVQVLDNCIFGKIKLLYISPERIESTLFLQKLKHIKVSFITVDEAHCISQWGHDFRPAYKKIGTLRRHLPGKAVLALTATATPRVIRDIRKQLDFRGDNIFRMSFRRSNLSYVVRRTKDITEEIIHILTHTHGSTIIYTMSRLKTHELCTDLEKAGFSSTYFHAGLDIAVKNRHQADWQTDKKRIIVATNAFGMGIDKSNVSFVIHYNMPQSMEAYYQEAGRAGRDGEKAECILLFGKRDIGTASFFIQKTYEESEQPQEERELQRQRDLQRLDRMVGYCDTPGCLRQYILNYFGQPLALPCGNCGNCTGITVRGKSKAKKASAPRKTGTLSTRDITREAQMVLSCIRRVEITLGHSSTISMTVQVLRGSPAKRLLESGLQSVSTYGLMSAYSREEIREILAHLKALGLVVWDKNELVTLTPGASGVLFRGSPVTVTLDEAELEQRFPLSGTVAADSRLLLELKELRAQLAKKEKVPAYVIFTNATLEDMAAKLPRTMEAFLTVSGVGAVKAERYGKPFLKLLKKYRSQD